MKRTNDAKALVWELLPWEAISTLITCATHKMGFAPLLGR